MDVDKIRDAIRRERPKLSVSKDRMLSSGSTTLDMACTGSTAGAFVMGSYSLLVGDSNSGKTWLSMTCLAEAVINPYFNNHRFIYDGPEGGAKMDIPYYFGQEVADRLEYLSSQTVEEFYYNLDDAFADGRPFIYILDSMDILSSAQEGEKFAKKKAAYRSKSKKKEPGTMTDAKAKTNSSHLRIATNKIKTTDSILIIINQTRDDLKPTFSPFPGAEKRKTRSGGHALSFYADVEVWSSVKMKLKKKVGVKDRKIGTISKVTVKRSRFTGKEAMVEVPIYFSVGIDNTGACVDYLIEEGHWKKRASGFNSVEFDLVGTKEEIVKHIEESNLEGKLKRIVGKVWKSIEDRCRIDRKPRYQ